MQTLDVISVNLWQILISLCNLLIMFLILKKLLFKPVQDMLAKRRAQVDTIYDEAVKDRAAAGEMKQDYEQRLAGAREEADSIVRNATQTATRKGDQIVADAQKAAAHMKQKAENEIAQERRQMLSEVRSEISDMAVSIAAKVVGREMNVKDQDKLIDEFIGNVGE